MEYVEMVFLSRWGNYVVMIAICVFIVGLLRLLFGPRGWFRDPDWDKRNAELRAAEAADKAKRQAAWYAEHPEHAPSGWQAPSNTNENSGKEEPANSPTQELCSNKEK